MEKEQSCALYALDHDFSSVDTQLPHHCLANWEQSMSQDANFDSLLSSLVSSPCSDGGGAADSVVTGELIGSICSSLGHSSQSIPKLKPSIGVQGSIAPQPLNSLQCKEEAELALSSIDSAFVERALKFSCFRGENYDEFTANVQLLENLKGAVSVASQKNGNEPFNSTKSSSSMDEVQQISSASNRTATKSNNAKTSKKGGRRGKRKEATLASSANNLISQIKVEHSDSKRCKTTETNGAVKDAVIKVKTEQNEDSCQKQVTDKNDNNLVSPKDYIHVRARRGQATDSHSLAERVRREKISERMKILQNLVPGCNKITGKAVMLDEIINYVQSLQQQVEFLSMKLAAVNTQLDLKVENFLPQDMHQSFGQMPQYQTHPVDSVSTVYSFTHENPLSSLQNIMQMPSLDAFADATSQLGNIWEDDLQSVVHMGFHGVTKPEEC